MDNNFSDRVKKLRAFLSISQEELARMMGVSFATINRWENGKTSPSRIARNLFEGLYNERMKNDENV